MSSPKERATARAPRRERGRRRVAALLEAAASLFAEKGYDAVTMTEVAARAGAPIGSLYQFFPSKEALADALLERIDETLADGLGRIEERATALTLPDLSDALLGLLAGSQEDRAAARALIESRREASARAAELRIARRRHVARILRAAIPGLPPGRPEVMAPVVIQLMKAAAQGAEEDPAARGGVASEMNYLMQLYLANSAVRRVDEGAEGR